MIGFRFLKVTQFIFMKFYRAINFFLAILSLAHPTKRPGLGLKLILFRLAYLSSIFTVSCVTCEKEKVFTAPLLLWFKSFAYDIYQHRNQALNQRFISSYQQPQTMILTNGMCLYIDLHIIPAYQMQIWVMTCIKPIHTSETVTVTYIVLVLTPSLFVFQIFFKRVTEHVC